MRLTAEQNAPAAVAPVPVLTEKKTIDWVFLGLSGALAALGLVMVFSASVCLLYTSPSPRDRTRSRMPSSA